MSILAAYAVPHPPILLPEVGHGEEQKIEKTAKAYAEVAACIQRLKPDVVIVASPHATLFADYFHISPGAGASGSLAQFHAPDVSLTVQYDSELAKRIEKLARGWQLPAGTMGARDDKLDHGTLIPLWLLRKAGVECNVVRLGLSGLPALTHYHLGPVHLRGCGITEPARRVSCQRRPFAQIVRKRPVTDTRRRDTSLTRG